MNKFLKKKIKKIKKKKKNKRIKIITHSGPGGQLLV